MKYTVKKGDTLTKIAQKHGTTVDAIVKINEIKNPNVINVGQVLFLPGETGNDSKIKDALNRCLDAVENLPEYKDLVKLL